MPLRLDRGSLLPPIAIAVLGGLMVLAAWWVAPTDDDLHDVFGD